MYKERNITKILKYFYDNEDIWIFSVQDKDINNKTFYRYYTMFFKNKMPIIIDLQNPDETLSNLAIKPYEVKEGSKDYVIFMAYKDVAERNIMNKIKR